MINSKENIIYLLSNKRCNEKRKEKIIVLFFSRKRERIVEKFYSILFLLFEEKQENLCRQNQKENEEQSFIYAIRETF